MFVINTRLLSYIMDAMPLSTLSCMHIITLHFISVSATYKYRYTPLYR
jgi:hypothetical protein